MKIFLEQDKLDFGKIIDQSPEKFNCFTVYSYEVGSVSIQSKALIHGVPHFIIQIKKRLHLYLFFFWVTWQRRIVKIKFNLTLKDLVSITRDDTIFV